MPQSKAIRHAVAEKMPGWRIVEPPTPTKTQHGVDTPPQAPAVDARGTPRSDLISKYFGPQQDVAPSMAAATAPADEPAQIVVVEPNNASAFRHRSGRKSVVMVGNKVVGVQG